MQRTLVLENYPPIRQALVQLLGREGWEVDIAQTDQQALTLLQQHSYEVLVLDMDIPTGDGWSVLTWRQAQPKSIPVVALLALDSPHLGRVQEQENAIPVFKP